MSDTLIHDLRYAARTWSKSPLFAFAAIVTIALGIGVSTAMFSVANAVLLKPLPYDDPDQLVLASGEFTRRSVKHWPFSNANFLDLRNGAKSSFEDLAGVLDAALSCDTRSIAVAGCRPNARQEDLPKWDLTCRGCELTTCLSVS